MATNGHPCPDPPDKTFTVGNTVFTVGDARRCMALEKARVTICQIKERYHPSATLEEIVCAIQVAIMSLSFHIDELSPLFFDPACQIKLYLSNVNYIFSNYVQQGTIINVMHWLPGGN